MDTKQLADFLNTNEQIVRAWVREGIIPAHRKPGGRKFTFLRHEILDWLITMRTRLAFDLDDIQRQAELRRLGRDLHEQAAAISSDTVANRMGR